MSEASRSAREAGQAGFWATPALVVGSGEPASVRRTSAGGERFRARAAVTAEVLQAARDRRAGSVPAIAAMSTSTGVDGLASAARVTAGTSEVSRARWARVGGGVAGLAAAADRTEDDAWPASRSSTASGVARFPATEQATDSDGSSARRSRTGTGMSSRAATAARTIASGASAQPTASSIGTVLSLKEVMNIPTVISKGPAVGALAPRDATRLHEIVDRQPVGLERGSVRIVQNRSLSATYVRSDGPVPTPTSSRESDAE